MALSGVTTLLAYSCRHRLRLRLICFCILHGATGVVDGSSAMCTKRGNASYVSMNMKLFLVNDKRARSAEEAHSEANLK